MKKKVILKVVLLLFLAGCSHKMRSVYLESPYKDIATLKKGEILHLNTGRLLSENELITYLSPYPVVFMGEIHDSIEDHNNQLKVIKGLNEKLSGEIAIGLEMLEYSSQKIANAFIRGDIEEREFYRTWSKDWNVHYKYYWKIIRYAKDNKIPLIALNTNNLTKKAFKKGIKKSGQSEPNGNIPDIDLDDSYYNLKLDAIFKGHAHGTKHTGMFKKMQTLWDETMAQNIANYLTSSEGKGKHLVVLSGSGHISYGFGIPRRLFRRLPVPYAVVVPVHVEIAEAKKNNTMDVEPVEIPLKPADIYWAVRYEGLEDEIVKLGVMLKKSDKGGVTVTKIIPNSSAENGGILKGDEIVSLDGKTVNSVSDIVYEISLRKPKDPGKIGVIRNGEEKEIDIVFEVSKHGHGKLTKKNVKTP